MISESYVQARTPQRIAEHVHPSASGIKRTYLARARESNEILSLTPL